MKTRDANGMANTPESTVQSISKNILQANRVIVHYNLMLMYIQCKYNVKNF